MRTSPDIRKTCRRRNLPGHTHFLTFSCFHRHPFLTRDRTRQWLADSILRARLKHDFRLLAWVFMPEHVHLLMRPRKKDYSIAAILNSIKNPVARKARYFVIHFAPAFASHMRDRQPSGKESLRFWQRGGGYDRNIFTPDELFEKIRYIHNNPCKRGLAQRPEDWIWSSAGDFAKVRTGPLPLDLEDWAWEW